MKKVINTIGSNNYIFKMLVCFYNALKYFHLNIKHVTFNVTVFTRPVWIQLMFQLYPWF